MKNLSIILSSLALVVAIVFGVLFLTKDSKKC